VQVSVDTLLIPLNKNIIFNIKIILFDSFNFDIKLNFMRFFVFATAIVVLIFHQANANTCSSFKGGIFTFNNYQSGKVNEII